MPPTRLILIGGGAHARVIADAVRSGTEPLELLGYVDPRPSQEASERLGLTCLGDDTALSRYPDAQAILGFGMIGSRPQREAVLARIAPLVSGWATVVHSTAWISPTARVGAGTVVMAGAVVQTGARIGAHCIVNTGAVVDHDVVLGDQVQIAPGVTIGGGAEIGAGAYVGLGASVRDHVRVGARAIVGMGAAVLGDVPDDAVVTGIPARPTGRPVSPDRRK